MQGGPLLLVAAAACFALLLDAAAIAATTSFVPKPNTFSRVVREDNHQRAFRQSTTSTVGPAASVAAAQPFTARRLARRSPPKRRPLSMSGAPHGGRNFDSRHKRQHVQLDSLNYAGRIAAVTSMYLYFFWNIIGESDPRPTRQTKADVSYKFCVSSLRICWAMLQPSGSAISRPFCFTHHVASRYCKSPPSPWLSPKRFSSPSLDDPRHS